MSKKQTELSEAVRAAREAVKDLQEPLKTEGFKIILGKLLSEEAHPSADKAVEVEVIGKSTNKAKKISSKNRSRKNASSLSTSLNLSQEQLKKLKRYCEGFNFGGTEQTAFIICNFLREHLELENINASDVSYCYRKLISLGIKGLPRVNELSDWERALYWLSAPSRKKEWLQKSNSGFVVSSIGLLRFNEFKEEILSKVNSHN